MEILDPNEEQYLRRKMQEFEKTPADEGGYFIKLLMKVSKINNIQQASYILLGAVIVMTVIALYVINVNSPHQVNPAAHWKTLQLLNSRGH